MAGENKGFGVVILLVAGYLVYETWKKLDIPWAPIPLTAEQKERDQDARAREQQRARANNTQPVQVTNPNIDAQRNEWQYQRLVAGENPLDWQAFRQFLIAIGAPDPGPTELAGFRVAGGTLGVG
jgi:hypothetical protein